MKEVPNNELYNYQLYYFNTPSIKEKKCWIKINSYKSVSINEMFDIDQKYEYFLYWCIENYHEISRMKTKINSLKIRIIRIKKQRDYYFNYSKKWKK